MAALNALVINWSFFFMVWWVDYNMKKSWIEKRDCEKSFKIKTIDKKFADIPKGSRMLIASPPIIDEYVKSILYGKFIEPVKMRDDLAKEYNADKTCPVTTGIF